MSALAGPSVAAGTVAAAPVDTLDAATDTVRIAGAEESVARAGPGVRGPAPAGEPAQGGPARAGADYFWVVRTALLSPRECDLVVARAASLGVRGLLVQVVGRADAYYRSDLLPRAEALGPGDFDPLGYLLPRAREAGLEVQAWVNCFLAWTAPWAPRDSTHIVRRRPEWLMWARAPRRPRSGGRDGGRSRVRGRPAQVWAPEGEGFYLEAANPEVRGFLARVVGEIVSRYPVDGVHLDYVRYPDAEVSVDALTRAEFAREAAGAAAADAAGDDRAQPGEAGATPAAAERWEAFRGGQITAFVREVRDTLARRRPGAQLTAAVIADTLSARARHGQVWTEWLRAGLIDQAFPMCYQPSTAGVMAQLAAFKRGLGAERVVPGLACYNQAPGGVAAKMKAARALGFERVALYSYDALYSQPGYVRQLERRLESGGAPREARAP